MPNQIKLYSTILHTSVKPRLKELIKQAESLQMSVAYWTINQNYFSSSGKKDNYLVKLLMKKDSFACIDISLPTNVSKVCEIAAQTDTIYFYTQSFYQEYNSLKEYTDKQPQKQPPRIQNHLLHSKILLFDLPNEQASIWIGSHNWTDRALSGINIEISLEILVDRNNRIYQEVKELLADIKNQCHKVNPQLEEVYKNIQRQENTWLYFAPGLDEEYIYTDLLATNTKNIVFHLFFSEYNPANIETKRRILLFLRDSTNANSGCLFEGSISGSGEIIPELSFPYFNQGYYCFQKYCGEFTNLKDIKSLSEEEKIKSRYYATIFLKSKPKKIESINNFLSNYKPAITVDRDVREVRRDIYSDDSLFPTEKIVLIKKPIIDKDSVDEYMTSEITHGKITKVTKKNNKSDKKRRK